jgi:subtilisin family serine protease
MVTGSSFPTGLNKVAATLFFLLLYPGDLISGQEKTYTYFYRVYFKDKGLTNISDLSLSDLFTAKAVERRIKSGTPAADFRDIPVNSGYIEQVSSLGFKLHCKSRWLNTALFKTETIADVNRLVSLPFISDVRIVKKPSGKSDHSDKLSFTTSQSDIPTYDRPLAMLNGLSVHNSGFNGKGILMAVLDGGFKNADQISSLSDLRNRNGIAGTFDFVKNSPSVYDYHNHGTAVLSVLAGSITGSIGGTAPGADFWLLRTEDTETEFPVEEDYWVAGAEFADSLGADIISSSLGYFTFDDFALNYKYSDMDGNTAFITRAADIAASRGILPVNSAGNERDNAWIHIIAPSDGDSVLAIGAVDGGNIISAFSSAGPSSDRRIKPDVVAQGVSVPVQVNASVIERSAGTSFSCPIISGMCACIMQAVPEATNYDIISALHESSDKYLTPDSLYGFGIPDIARTISLIQEKLVIKPDDESLAYPNPFNEQLKIAFRQAPSQLMVEIFNWSGKLMARIIYNEYVSRSVTLDYFKDLPPGIYIIRLTTRNDVQTHKVMKIRN